MDTSKTYYESVMRDYNMYRRGRTLEQYCRDEGVDFQWLTKANKQYSNTEDGNKTKKNSKPARSLQPDKPELIRLHYLDSLADEGTSSVTTDQETSKMDATSDMAQCSPQWTVQSLKVRTPDGEDIEISNAKPKAIVTLLLKLSF